MKYNLIIIIMLLNSILISLISLFLNNNIKFFGAFFSLTRCNYWMLLLLRVVHVHVIIIFVIQCVSFCTKLPIIMFVCMFKRACVK